MDTTLQAPDSVLPKLIELIAERLGAGHSNLSKGRKWGDNGNALDLEPGQGSGKQAFIHCKTEEEYKALYKGLLQTLNLVPNGTEYKLTEYSGKDDNVKGPEIKFFSVFLIVNDSKTDSALEGADSLGVIHNPNY
ncbi:hypothetical protein ACFQT0_18280 [Hymenobacter humi]|uniref:Uncharacterized protein n=1 Tax=Hymenobacter humi TaxID=1411620 RepID=A0ABW2U9U8_9BACT